MTVSPVRAESAREKVLLPAPAIPSTSTREPIAALELSKAAVSHLGHSTQRMKNLWLIYEPPKASPTNALGSQSSMSGALPQTGRPSAGPPRVDGFAHLSLIGSVCGNMRWMPNESGRRRRRR